MSNVSHHVFYISRTSHKIKNLKICEYNKWHVAAPSICNNVSMHARVKGINCHIIVSWKLWIFILRDVCDIRIHEFVLWLASNGHVFNINILPCTPGGAYIYLKNISKASLLITGLRRWHEYGFGNGLPLPMPFSHYDRRKPMTETTPSCPLRVALRYGCDFWKHFPKQYDKGRSVETSFHLPCVF